MPTQRDYLIATLMGEDNRADRQGMQGILDVIANRADQFSRYGATSGSYKDVVTARNGLEFNAWMPNDNSYSRTTRALQGLDAMQGAEVGQYKQAASVVDDFLNKGEGRGISQGATFYQTPTAPNKYQSGTLWPKYGNITIGNHVYTGDKLVKDKAEYQRLFPSYFQPALNAPAPGTDYFGKSLDVSGDVANGAIGSGPQGGVLETGSGTDFSNIDASGNIGPGSNNLGTATPIGPAPGKFDFADFGTPGGIGDPNFGAGITPNAPPGPAPGPYDFGAGIAEGGTPNGSFGAGIAPIPLPEATPTLPAPPGSSVVNSLYQAILGRPGDAPSLQAFDAELDSGRMDLNAIQAALAASPEAQALGAPPTTRTYSPLETVFARQFDRAPGAAAIQNWGSVNGSDIGALEAQLYGTPEAQTYRSGLGDLAGLIGPGAAPTVGVGSVGTIPAPAPTPTVAPTNSVTASPGIGNFDFSSAYLQANPDVAKAGMNPWEHFLRYGLGEGRAINTAGDRFDANAYLLQNADVKQAGQDALTHYLTYGASEGRAAPLIGPDGTVHNVASFGVTPTLGASLAQYLQPQGTAPNVPAPFGQTIAPSPNQSVTASPGVGPYDFASNYLAANRDVADAGMGAWEHFLRYGAKEGRAIDTAGDKFDASRYLLENADVRDAGQDALTHFLTYGAAEGRDAPIVGPDGTVRDIGNLGLTPTLAADLVRFLQPQSVAPTIAPQTAPTIGAPDAVQAWSQGTVSPYAFGGNVSQGVGLGSFGTGITPTPQISPYGFSGLNPSSFLGATNQGLGGSYAVGSAANLGFGGGSGGDGTIDPYGFGKADVSGFDVNQTGGGQPATPDTRAPLQYGDGAAIQGRGSQLGQNAYFATQAKQQALSTANANLFGQQITGIAPGNQTVYDYATGKATGGQAPSIQQTPFTPVNMGGVFAPLPTAVFMPRFTG